MQVLRCRRCGEWQAVDGDKPPRRCPLCKLVADFTKEPYLPPGARYQLTRRDCCVLAALKIDPGKPVTEW